VLFYLSKNYSTLGVCLHHFLNQVNNFIAHLKSPLFEQLGRVFHEFVVPVIVHSFAESLPCKHLKEQHSKSEDVHRSTFIPLSSEQLGGHLSIGTTFPCQSLTSNVIHAKAEVSHLHNVIFCDKTVFQLHVQVENSFLVEIAETVKHLFEQELGDRLTSSL